MSEKQTGITTQQMRDAPDGAVFVWCNDRIQYPLALARAIGRADLSVKPLSWLRPENVLCRQPSGLVLDHAAPLLSDAGYEALMHARSRGIPETRS